MFLVMFDSFFWKVYDNLIKIPFGPEDRTQDFEHARQGLLCHTSKLSFMQLYGLRAFQCFPASFSPTLLLLKSFF